MNVRASLFFAPLAAALMAGLVGLHFFRQELRANEAMARLATLSTANMTESHLTVLDELASFPAGRRRVIGALTGEQGGMLHIEASGWGLGPEWHRALAFRNTDRLMKILDESEKRGMFVESSVPDHVLRWEWYGARSSSVQHGSLRIEIIQSGDAHAAIAHSGQSKDPLWTVILKGFGPIRNKRFGDEVELRVIDGFLVVRGRVLFGGEYAEVLVPDTGKRLRVVVTAP